MKGTHSSRKRDDSKKCLYDECLRCKSKTDVGNFLAYIPIRVRHPNSPVCDKCGTWFLSCDTTSEKDHRTKHFFVKGLTRTCKVIQTTLIIVIIQSLFRDGSATYISNQYNVKH